MLHFLLRPAIFFLQRPTSHWLNRKIELKETVARHVKLKQNDIIWA